MLKSTANEGKVLVEYKGKQYVRVSTILQKFVDFGAATPEQVERKRIIGTDVHQAIDDDLNHCPHELSADAKPYFESYLRWKEGFTGKILETEKRYFDDEHRFTGKIDLLVEYDSFAPIIIDFKCTYRDNPITWPLQGHFYHYLASKEVKVMGTRCLFINLSSKGLYPKVYSYEIKINTIAKCLKEARLFWKREEQNLHKNFAI